MIAWPVGEPIASGGAIYESNEGDNRITLEIGASDGGNPNQPQTRRTFLPMLSTPIGVPSSGFEGALSFRPRPNGFSFQNYGGPTDQSSVLTPDELARMFGANKVCENGALPCVLNGPARQWRDKWVKSLNGGQCYGMAVTASRFTEGSDNPGKFTAGATTIFGIEQTRAVEQHIAYYFITQALAPENLALGGWITDKKPSEYIQIMREGFAKNQSYVIGFFKRNKTGGHAVTPYAIKNMGNGLVRLLVYDNNWPDQERFFEFDLNRETWSYNFGTTRPGEPVDLYEGDDRTNTFQIRPITSHPETGWQCPFCQDTPGLVSTQAVSDTIAFQYNGEGRILLIDPQGKRLGYNPTTRQTLSEIRGQGVTEQPFLGGLGKEIPPYIELPYLESTTTFYQVVLSGNELEAESSGDLTISVDGVVVGFTDVTLRPGSEVTFTLRADLGELRANTTIDDTMGMYISVDLEDPSTTENESSLIIELGDIDFNANDEIALQFTEDGKMIVRNSRGDATTVDIILILIDGIAGDEEWSQDDYNIDRDEDLLLDFSQWDGSDDANLWIYTDEDGDGFNDETPTPIKDEDV